MPDSQQYPSYVCLSKISVYLSSKSVEFCKLRPLYLCIDVQVIVVEKPQLEIRNFKIGKRGYFHYYCSDSRRH